MYQSIGINLSKDLDARTKRVKVPAITQREYYKESNNSEDEYFNFYKGNSDDDCIDCEENLKYLDDDYDECTEDDCACDDSCCFIDKMKHLDSKVLIGASIGALVGCVGIYFLLKRK